MSNTEARRHRAKDFTTPHEPRVMQGCTRRSAAVMSAATTSLQRQENNLLTTSGWRFLGNVWIRWQQTLWIIQKTLVSSAIRANDGKLGKPSNHKSKLKPGTPTLSHRPSAGHPRATSQQSSGDTKIRALRGIWAAARSLV